MLRIRDILVQIKSQKEVTKQRNQLHFCFMMEGSEAESGAGAGAVLVTNGSGCGSGRPKNIRIQRMRIRIRNTARYQAKLPKQMYTNSARSIETFPNQKNVTENIIFPRINIFSC